MKKKKNDSFGKILIFLFFIFLCGSIFGLLQVFRTINNDLESKFGAPSPELNQINRLKTAWDLYFHGNDLFEEILLNEEPYIFEIAQGETIGQIVFRLTNDQIIENPDLFRVYLIYRGYDRFVQAGVFQIESGMNAIEIANKIINPTPELVPFNILAGWRAEEIAASLPRSGLEIDPQEFLAFVKNPDENWFHNEAIRPKSLEGFLGPGEYVVNREIALLDFIRLLTDRFEENVTPDLLSGIDEAGLSLTEVVILGSIVERETILAEEMPLIASVYLNRYRINMKLDSDPTVQYGLGFNQQQGTWWTNPLSINDLQDLSPYNTYLYNGLPPGPICNPSLAAIQSIINPEETDYYYFRAKCDGSGLHEFAVSYEEHLENGCE